MPRPRDKKILSCAIGLGLGGLLGRLGGLNGSILESGKNLSSGEFRRVLLARAILSESPLLLIDELDEAMDQSGIRRIIKLLKRSKATIICSTHNKNIASVADRILMMHGGKFVSSGENPGDLD